MKKDWFVFQKDHHQGPFLKEEIVSMIYDDKLTEKTLIWQVGSDGWKPIYEIDEFSSDLKQKGFSFDDLSSNNDCHDIENTSEVKPTVAPFLESDVEKIKKVEKVLPSEIMPTEKVKNSFQKSLKISIGVISFLAILLVSYFVLFSDNSIKDTAFSNITQTDFSRLNKTANLNDFSTIRFAVALSSKNNEIYVSSNNPGVSHVIAKFESMPGKIIDKNRVILTSRGIIKNNNVVLSKLKFMNGAKVIPGYYLLRFKVQNIGGWNRFRKILKRTGAFNWIGQIKYYKDSFSYSTTVLLFSGLKGKFQKELNVFNKKEKAEKSKEIIDYVESYTTCISLLKRLKVLFDQTVVPIRKTKEIRAFELKYMSEIGPILEGIIIHNFDKNIIKISNGLKYAGEKLKIVELGKEIGQLVTDTIFGIKDKKRISPKAIIKIQKHFNAQIEKLDLLAKTRLFKYQGILEEIEATY